MSILLNKTVTKYLQQKNVDGTCNCRNKDCYFLDDKFFQIYNTYKAGVIKYRQICYDEKLKS